MLKVKLVKESDGNVKVDTIEPMSYDTYEILKPVVSNLQGIYGTNQFMGRIITLNCEVIDGKVMIHNGDIDGIFFDQASMVDIATRLGVKQVKKTVDPFKPDTPSKYEIKKEKVKEKDEKENTKQSDKKNTKYSE